MPIRSLRTNNPNITTLIGDITTDKCKSDIQRTLKGTPVDVVLHDGAPNVGAEYGKDAYQQNELALHALRCATQHLIAGGAFCTKVYRSRDYASLTWLLQQLFGTVQALKPAASRSQSAEIFIICQDYKAPAKLDPRLLDPKYVFEDVQGETTGGTIGGNSNAMSVFHKNWDKPRRKRGGYDLDHLSAATLQHIEPVSHFCAVSSLQAAIQILSTSTGLSFACERCSGKSDRNGNEEENKTECGCQFFLHHPLTTPEIKECVSDLQVLNRSDFKRLLTWRTKMQDAVRARREVDRSDDEKSVDSGASRDSELDSDQEEEEIQAEISEMRQRRQRERKRQKKKERAVAAKRRRHAALGMDLNAIDVPEHDKVFSLATITSKGDLEAAAEVNLDQMTDKQIFGEDNSDEEVVVGKQEAEAVDLDKDELLRRRERDLEDAYTMYLESTKNELAKSGTKMAKRSKKAQRQKVVDEAAEDQEMAAVAPDQMDYNARTYAEMLQGPKDSDEEDSDGDESSEDDGFGSAPLTPDEHAQKHRSKRQKQEATNPLIHKFADEPTSIKTARWFSNPLFETIGRAAQSTSVGDSDDDGKYESDEDDRKPKAGLSAEEVLASMPKTDKQKRHEKRIKAKSRDERRKSRLAKRLGEAEGKFDLAPAHADDSDDEKEQEDFSHLSEAQRKKVLEARELIKAGMGNIATGAIAKGLEIVPTDSVEHRPLPIMDDRKYDSEHEDYDSDDYARTLALGTMMLRRSKEKALVDASYNRYAWNDSADLPSWFVDDEAKHYRPQLPIPPALIAKMKEKMLVLSSKPIKKVAEARARKSKRAKLKLAAAKRKAEAVANSSEMSEAMKLRAISKALRGQESSSKQQRPGKSYVVAKKGGQGQQGAKGVKLVDKRMKADKRALARIDKKRKKGKQNKLVGSKKRRSHS